MVCQVLFLPPEGFEFTDKMIIILDRTFDAMLDKIYSSICNNKPDIALIFENDPRVCLGGREKVIYRSLILGEKTEILEQMKYIYKYYDLNKEFIFVFIPTDKTKPVIYRRLDLPDMFEIKEDYIKDIKNLNIDKYKQLWKDKTILQKYIMFNTALQCEFTSNVKNIKNINYSIVREIKYTQDAELMITLCQRNNYFNFQISNVIHLLYMPELLSETRKKEPRVPDKSLVMFNSNDGEKEENMIGMCLFSIIGDGMVLFISFLLLEDIKDRYGLMFLRMLCSYAKDNNIKIIYTESLCRVSKLSFWRNIGFSSCIYQLLYENSKFSAGFDIDKQLDAIIENRKGDGNTHMGGKNWKNFIHKNQVKYNSDHTLSMFYVVH